MSKKNEKSAKEDFKKAKTKKKPAKKPAKKKEQAYTGGGSFCTPPSQVGRKPSVPAWIRKEQW